MRFDDIDVNDSELEERLSSWRRLPALAEKRRDEGEGGVNEREVRLRQRRAGIMCLNLVTTHAAFYAQLEAFVQQQEERSPAFQSRVEDMASFALGVLEQFGAENLHNGLKNELDGLPKEIIETVTVPAPLPPKSWWQRLIRG